jgi:hypothetical protein
MAALAQEVSERPTSPMCAAASRSGIADLQSEYWSWIHACRSKPPARSCMWGWLDPSRGHELCLCTPDMILPSAACRMDGAVHTEAPTLPSVAPPRGA